ncbi:tyrosine protein phosphatase [Plantactinospora sp. S1510]|uniref:protein-tyrosine-phosphatase n=1 Tax=Plantactinospora alkalitolerans TaxID=2789879 RepID=A0ABS0H7U5_9ACTN|nr:tyrosine protein phosphatase [Plantactinospora alkalitolerans]MBF9134548.1 tyrosine protein phosphatase [Plantactinospora alkalitolerans]
MWLRPTIYPIPAPSPVRLSIVARPRGDDWLDDEMAGLRRCGVDILVCLLTSAERDELGLTGEDAAAARAGIDYHAYPVIDRGVPEHAAIRPLIDVLAGDLARGRHLAVHCRASIGRSSLLVAALLSRLDVPVDRIWDIIGGARGVPVPETEEQRRWLDDHHRQAAGGRGIPTSSALSPWAAPGAGRPR